MPVKLMDKDLLALLAEQKTAPEVLTPTRCPDCGCLLSPEMEEGRVRYVCLNCPPTREQ